jgi:three-Cys-motif partner protein
MPNKHYEWGSDGSIPKIGEHSLAKHRIIEDYVGRYLKILTSNVRQPYLNLTIVDGFCGGGLYSYKNEEVYGSPLILLRTIRAVEAELSASRRNGFKINADFFFVDEILNHCKFLEDQIQKSEFKKELGQSVHIRNNQFENAAPEIINLIKKKGTAHRSLFFLDQYGWSDVSFITIKQILTVLNRPEVLLTFAVDALINFLNMKQVGSRAFLSIELERSDVKELLSRKDQSGWRYLIQNDLYRHIQKHTGVPFYTPFFIKSPESQRSYWLLHLSKHYRARDEMATLHWEKQNHFVHHGKPGFQALGFDPSKDFPDQFCLFDFDSMAHEQSKQETLIQIPRLVRNEEVSSNQGMTLEEIFSRHCNETPVTKKIMDESLSELRQQDEIEVASKDGKDKPRANTFLWDDRIRTAKQRKLF